MHRRVSSMTIINIIISDKIFGRPPTAATVATESKRKSQTIDGTRRRRRIK
jgi:hypothetical protein